MNKADNARLNKLYTEAVQLPPSKFGEWEHEDRQTNSNEVTVWVVYEDYHGTTIIGVYTDRDVAEEVSNQSNKYSMDSVVLNAK